MSQAKYIYVIHTDAMISLHIAVNKYYIDKLTLIDRVVGGAGMGLHMYF